MKSIASQYISGRRKRPQPSRRKTTLRERARARLLELVNGDAEEDTVPLKHYIWILKRHSWRIAAFVFTITMCTLVISKRATPIYESTATVYIDRSAPAGLMGIQSMPSYSFDSEQFLSTQIRLMQSNSVLRPVNQKYNVIPNEYIGKDGKKRRLPANRPLAFAGLQVSRAPNTYLLNVRYRSPDPQAAADIANAVAQSYVQHTYDLRFQSAVSLSDFMEKQLEQLKAKMERSSEALQNIEREMNVLNPEEKTSMLSARLLQLNQEFTTAQADRVRKQAAFETVKGGSLEAAMLSSQREVLIKAGNSLHEAERKFAEVRAHYGVNHPEFKKAAAQVAELDRHQRQTKDQVLRQVELEFREAMSRESMIQKELFDQKAEFDRLSARSLEYQAIRREAGVDRKFYEELVHKIKEAGINSSFQNHSIRIADAALPASAPVFPNIPQNVFLAVMFSGVLGVAFALARETLDNSMRDPEKVSRALRCEVVGTLPLVREWKGRLSLGPAAGSGALAPRTENHRVEGYRESARALRNSVLLSGNQPLRSVLITSASPGEGKSTIALHLAMANAEQHHRTLLVDADLRRPSLHRRLGVEPPAGLASVVSGEMGWREAVTPVEGHPNLEVMTAGPSPRGSAELVGQTVSRIMHEAGKEYDLIVLDSPPLLGFSEPLQMATLVDGVLVVALADKTNRKAVASVIHAVHRLGANMAGLVINEVSKQLGESYYYYGHGYSYYHKYYARGERAGG